MRLFSLYGWVRARYEAKLRRSNFVSAPWAGGVVLLVCVVVAMLLANLPWTAHYYHEFLETGLTLSVHSPSGSVNWIFPEGMTVEKWINDGLMVIFFFIVGLEIKRELLCGHLSSFRRAILPVLAAMGGMLMPALIYLAFNAGTPASTGWGIPTATDIAFAVGILSMLGDRVPVSLKIFLTALAVVDDLGAILVIALFYGGQLHWDYLAAALLVMALVYAMNRMGEKRMIFYFVPAVTVWTLFYYSGIHSTLSGVAMALLVPIEPRFSKSYFLHKTKWLKIRLVNANADLDADGVEDGFPNEEHRFFLRQLKRLSSQSIGMSYRLENALTPYVTFLIMPIFALANAGVTIPSMEYIDIFQSSPETGASGMGIFFGLLVGKPLGIFLASWVAVKSRLAVMPDGGTWGMLLAVACLGGIGFTMSLFVDSLAFTDPELIDRGKIAILMGSIAAAAAGSLLILVITNKQK